MQNSTARLVRPLPYLLRDALDQGGLRDIDRWWRDLDSSSQEDVLKLWEDCADLHFGSPREEDYAMELRVIGTAQDPRSDHFEGFWNHEFYEYLVNHEAFYFEETKFYICTSQPAARDAIQKGLITPDFLCDLSSATCPIRSRIDEFGGRSIRLSITFVPKPRSPLGDS